MRFGIQAGVYSAVAGLGGAGAIVIAPAQLWIGYSLIIAAAALLAWGITVDGQFWWRRLRRAASRRGEWVSLREALRYIVEDSQWGREYASSDWHDADSALSREFMEAAGQEAVRVRGRRRIGGALAIASEPIPASFWSTAAMQSFFEMLCDRLPALRDDAGSMRPAVWTNRLLYSLPDGIVFGAVLVNAADMAKRWPAASRRAPMNQASALASAFQAYAREATGDPTWAFDRETDMLLGGS